MASSVEFTSQNYGIAYPDSNSFELFNNVVAQTINAYQDENNNAYNLTLGASSNVNVEAVNGINFYTSPSDSLTYYNTVVQNNHRIDTKVLQISQCNLTSTTYIEAQGLALCLSGLDSAQTTTVSQTTFTSADATQVLATSQPNGFVIENPIVVNSGLTDLGNMTVRQNLVVDQNIISSSMNLIKSDGNGGQTAYAFYINEWGQLDLVRYGINTQSVDGNTTIRTDVQRLFTWGKSNDYHMGDLQNYTGLNTYTGGTSVAPSTNNTSPSSALAWQTSPSVNNGIYYSLGYVGIGSQQPRESLDVVGQIRVTSGVYPAQSGQANLGKPNNIFNTAYVNTVNLHGGQGGVDGTIYIDAIGNLIMEDGNSAQFNMTNVQNSATWSSNLLGVGGIITAGGNSVWSTSGNSIYLMNSNVGIGVSSPAYALDVTTVNVRQIMHAPLITSSDNTANITLGNSSVIISAPTVITGGSLFTGSNITSSNVKLNGQMTLSNQYGVTTYVPGGIVFGTW